MTVESASSKTKICFVCKGHFAASATHCPVDGTMLADNDPLVGTLFDGKYEVVSLAGQGGFGMVYKARHAQLERTVAIKILKSIATSDPDNVHRFIREAKAASELLHPNIAAVYAFGVSSSGEAYLVMEYVEGRKLSDILGATGAMPMPRALDLIRQVCAALSCAHHKSIIHRDIKPGNIIVLDGDVVKVVDFGSAKFLAHQDAKAQQVTRPGDQIGTAEYMSPEQCGGGPVDQRADVYAIGKVLCELVSVDGKIPSEIVPIADRALQQEAHKRYADADEMLRDIDAVASRHQVNGATMKLVSSPAGAGATVRGAPRLVLGLIVAFGIGLTLLAFFDEALSAATQAALNVSEPVGLFKPKGSDDFLIKLIAIAGEQRGQTQQVLAEAVVRHTEQREGRSFGWMDAVTRLLKMRKADGKDVRSDPYSLAVAKQCKKIGGPIVTRMNAAEVKEYAQTELRWAQVVCRPEDPGLQEAHVLLIDLARKQPDMGTLEKELRAYKEVLVQVPGAKANNILARLTIELADTLFTLKKYDEAERLVPHCIDLVINAKLPDGALGNPLHVVVMKGQQHLSGQSRVDLLRRWLTTIPQIYSMPCSVANSPQQALVEASCILGDAYLGAGDSKSAETALADGIAKFTPCVPWQSRSFLCLSLLNYVRTAGVNPNLIPSADRLVAMAKQSKSKDCSAIGRIAEVQLALSKRSEVRAYQVAQAVIPYLYTIERPRQELFYVNNVLSQCDMNMKNWQRCALYARRAATFTLDERAKDLCLQRAEAAKRHQRYTGL